MDESAPSVDTLYGEWCSMIRATDEISFKLPGLVVHSVRAANPGGG